MFKSVFARTGSWPAVSVALLMLAEMGHVSAAGLSALPGAESSDGEGAPAAAPAENSGDLQANDLQEIVVTANRRAESLQRSSLAIDAFSNEQLQSRGVAEATDLTKLVQGLQVSFVGSTINAYVRGVGAGGANPLANPGVSVNVDGVYIGRPESVGVNFFDVERVEVLKGPQGTLYGRNTTGGAINVITNSPLLGEVKGAADAEVGDYGLYRLEGAINIPLGSVVAFRLAANRIKRDGYLSDGTNDDDESAARMKLLVQPNEDLSVLVSLDGEEVRGSGGGIVYLPRRPGSSAWEGSSSPEGQLYAHTFNPNLISSGPPAAFVHNNFYSASAQLDWNLGFATLTAIPAYRHTSVDSLQYNAGAFGQTGFSNQSSFELRLGHAGDWLKWVAGAYYYNERDPGQVFPDLGKGLLQANPQYNPTTESYALFGDANLSVSERFRVIAGARLTREIHKLTGDFYVSPRQDGTYIDAERFFGNKAFGSFTWRAGAEYDLAPQSMLYFTASTGFKSGGITQTVPPENVYDPETVRAFELGSRNRFLNNMLQVNLEAFDWKYKNQQIDHLTFDTLGNVNFITQNAGNAHLYGLNADLLFRPTHEDTMHLAVEYDHSRYTSFAYQEPAFAYSTVATNCANDGVVAGPFVPLATVDCSGFALPHAPLWSGQVDITHNFEVSNGGSVGLTLSDRFSSATWLSVDFIPAERAPSFTKLDASVAYFSPARNYSFTAYVRNINNGREYTGGSEQAQVAPLFGGVITAPRTYGVRAHVDF
jgi:iron complex outermembrane recepter protein